MKISGIVIDRILPLARTNAGLAGSEAIASPATVSSSDATQTKRCASRWTEGGHYPRCGSI